MSKKSQTTLAPEVKARGLTENTTGVYRLPKTVKAAIEAEAESTGESPAAIVRQALARELERREYELAPETKRACHIA